MNDGLIQFGGAVKSLGGGKVGGYLIRFSTDKDPDLAADFFSAETDFDTDFPSQKSVYFDHGMDATLKKTKLGRADMKIDDVGVWAETILDASQKYQAAILALVDQGALGWSSGSISHIVEREAVGKSTRLTLWPIAECSLTPTPCEPRNLVQSLKSYEAEHAAVKSFKSLLSELAEGENDTADEAKSLPLDPVPNDTLSDDEDEGENKETRRVLSLLAGLPLKSYLGAVGAIASDADRRLSWYDTSRSTKQGRAISAENLAAMQDIHTGLQAHVNHLATIIARHTPENAPDAAMNNAEPDTGDAPNKGKSLESAATDREKAQLSDAIGAQYSRYLYLASHGGAITL